MCVYVCRCSGFTPGEDRQLLCGGEDAGEGQPISHRATETAPVWSECQQQTQRLLVPLWMKLGQRQDTYTGWYWWFNAVLFQELECAVSVEEDNRQEWTFTLYDFDNNGKVTREVTIMCSEPLMYVWASKQQNTKHIINASATTTEIDLVGTVIPIMLQK